MRFLYRGPRYRLSPPRQDIRQSDRPILSPSEGMRKSDLSGRVRPIKQINLLPIKNPLQALQFAENIRGIRFGASRLQRTRDKKKNFAVGKSAERAAVEFGLLECFQHVLTPDAAVGRER